MSDLVERLRGDLMTPYQATQLMDEAADRIEQLEAALRPFAVAANGFDAQRIKNPEEWFAYSGVTSNAGSVGAITVGDLRRARAALGASDE